jgi:hypothetical protein
MPVQLMSFDFPFVRLFGVREFCYYPYLVNHKPLKNTRLVGTFPTIQHQYPESKRCICVFEVCLKCVYLTSFYDFSIGILKF